MATWLARRRCCTGRPAGHVRILSQSLGAVASYDGRLPPSAPEVHHAGPLVVTRGPPAVRVGHPSDAGAIAAAALARFPSAGRWWQRGITASVT